MDDRWYVVVRLNPTQDYRPDRLAHNTVYSDHQEAQRNTDQWNEAYPSQTYAVRELFI